MGLKFTLKGIDRIAASLSSLSDGVDAGVKVIGDVNYIKAMVWDMGYITRQINPGPKTLWSVNVLGEPKVLTITAPTGFIRIQRNEYLAVLRDELQKADFPNKPLSQWHDAAVTMMTNAAQRCAAIVSGAAPIDTGELRSSIAAAPPGDPTLRGGTGPSNDLESWLL